MGDLPKGWTQTDLVNLVRYQKGKKPKTFSESQAPNTLPYLDIEAFVNNNVRQYADTESSKVATQDDVLVVWDGARSGLVGLGREGAIGSTIVALTPIKVEKLYLLYFIQNKYQYINDNHRGSGIPHVNPDVFWPLQVPLPPLNEQRRIVAKLEKLLAKVNACQERLDKIPTILKRFRQSVLAAACSGRLTADWREQYPDIEPAEELLKRIQEERIRRYEEECKKAKDEGQRKPRKPKDYKCNKEHNFNIPPTWSVAHPEDISSHKEYSIGIGPFGSNLKVSDYQNEGVPLVFVRNIRSGNFTDLNPKYISRQKAMELSPHVVEPLDLLITKMGEPPGDCEIYPSDSPEAVITADCLKFRIWEDNLERLFFKYCINSFIVKEQLGLITKGVAQQKISVERFKSILIPVPPFEEQEEIVRRVESLFQKCDQLEARYHKAKAYTDKLTQAILAKAFRGELVPQDPNDEPAEVLLERIKAEKATATAKPQKTIKKRGKKASSPQQTIPGME